MHKVSKSKHLPKLAIEFPFCCVLITCVCAGEVLEVCVCRGQFVDDDPLDEVPTEMSEQGRLTV